MNKVIKLNIEGLEDPLVVYIDRDVIRFRSKYYLPVEETLLRSILDGDGPVVELTMKRDILYKE